MTNELKGYDAWKTATPADDMEECPECDSQLIVDRYDDSVECSNYECGYSAGPDPDREFDLDR